MTNRGIGGLWAMHRLLKPEKPLRRHTDRWLDRWLAANADLARLQYEHRMVDAVIEEVDGRDIRIGRQWLADFASCNYLGFDLDPEIIAAVPGYLERWGTHPSWSRLLGSPALYEEIEEGLTELLGCDDVLVLPTITHIHMAVIPVLAAEARSSSTGVRTRRSTTGLSRRRATAPRSSVSGTTTPTISSATSGSGTTVPSSSARMG